MRFQSYFNTAVKIIQLYDGAIPLQHFLKQYFSQYKKHGSKDRKLITHLCYNFYRLGKAFNKVNIEEKLKTAIFICNDVIEEWKFLYEAEWINNHTANLDNRLAFIQTKYLSFSLQEIFPFINQLSKGLDTDAFIRSFLIQPDVFIRTRPGYYATVTHRLQQHGIAFTVVEENCIRFSPFTKIDTVIDIDEEAVVQDISSQRVKEFFEIVYRAISYQLSAISYE
jgi:16S rRNA (cytosine967-C5)-methyltransferase